jgi:hypothetical protein
VVRHRNLHHRATAPATFNDYDAAICGAFTH